MSSPNLRRAVRMGGVATAFVMLVGSATVSAHDAGWRTAHDPMLAPVLQGAKVEALITVGDTLPGGYRFESIPDGISLATRGHGRADVYVNHETSTVPFPYTPGAPTEANSQNDFHNSELSHLVLSAHSGNILSGRMAISTNENFQRFCSNFLATAAQGFDRPILFTNEEGIDWVNRSGKAWPATIGADEARQAGVVVAFDVRNGKRRPIWGMGRHNHENTVAIPGYRKVVLLSGDDTFTNSPSQSQLYSYIARDGEDVWKDKGSLYAFKPDPASGKTKYEDFAPNSTESIKGRFIRVPRAIATGRNADGTDVMAADFGFPLPPNDGSWQRDPSGIGVDGPQWVLDYWSRTNGAFGFIRVEDIAYDKRPGKGNIVYVVDSGRGTAPTQPAPPAPPVPTFGPGLSTNGRVWKMVLDRHDPTRVTSMSILIEGDDHAVKDPNEIHQPDNIESTAKGLYLTEDPGSSQQFPFGSTDPNATTGRVWRYDLKTGATAVAFRVDQSADGGPTDVDGAAPGRLGAWEASGIVDASRVFGPGAFLVTVQAHTLWVDKAPGDDNFAPAGPDFTYKREGGQLLLVRVPNG
ncbi:MAG: alkaline phosphatase PhoX [Candidatus Limnocylindrales bacterium]